MDAKELLKPRYKVIAGDTSGNWAIGDIIEFENDYRDRPIFYTWITGERKGYNPEFFNNYPHLFTKLEWWQERKESDMPEYVKWKEYVHKVTYKVIGGILNFQSEGEKIFQSVSFAAYRGIQPATKEEYLNQQ